MLMIRLKLFEEASSFPVTHVNPVNQLVKKEAVWIFKFLELVQLYSNGKLHHVDPEDRKIYEEMFSNGKFGFLIGMFLLASCLKEKFSKDFYKEKQKFGIYLNRRDLVYTKGQMLEFYYFDSNIFSSKRGKLSYSAFAPSRSQFKSKSYPKKHPPVIVGQWSPSSSEDG
jgi:hypothetical protein